MESLLWGIDLGGTKIEGLVITASGTILARERLPTEREKGYEHIIAQIKQLLQVLSQKSGHKPQRLGIGTPGAIDPTSGFMKNSNTTVLNNRPFHVDLQTALGIPVVLANDANCFAIAEARFGAASSYWAADHIVFGIIMGTGVGGGLVINQKVWTGTHAIGGEWGHNFMDESGGACYCGKTGCVETLISGTGLEKYYFENSGESLQLAEIVRRYEAGDKTVMITNTVERLVYFFGKSVANVINLLDPTAIVLGGGLSQIDLLYSVGVEEIAKHLFNKTLETPILKPKLGDSAGVFGAAMLVV